MERSDEALYARYLASGDEDAFRVLLERHREGLTLFLRSFVPTLEDAEDLMIDAFAVAASGTAAFSGGSSFRTWLFAIGRNLARSHLRRQRVPAPEEAPDAVTPELELLRSERSRRLYEAMAGLKQEYRQVLFLLYFEQMSQDDAARIMRKTKKQIYHLTSRGRDALRAALERTGFEYEIL